MFKIKQNIKSIKYLLQNSTIELYETDIIQEMSEI